MNLRDFLSHRNVCPLCSSSLSLALHSRKRQKVRIVNDRLLITFQMTSLKKNSKSYQVGYSINQYDNSFLIEFYTKDGKQFEHIPLSLLQQFEAFNYNLGQYKFYNYCNVCKDFHYESNFFYVDLEKCTIGDLSIRSDYFSLRKDDKIFGLHNNYESNKSLLTVDKDYNDNGYVIETALINFVSKEETLNRLNKLILFS